MKTVKFVLKKTKMYCLQCWVFTAYDYQGFCDYQGFWLSLLGLAVYWTEKLNYNYQGFSCDDLAP